MHEVKMSSSVPSILSLPLETLDQLALTMDSSEVYNWRRIVEHLEDYTQRDIMILRNIEQKGRSASMALLKDLNSRGWNIVHLAELAKKANIIDMLDTIQQYCEDNGLDISLPTRTEDTPPSSVLRSAKSCLHKKPYPTTIAPPLLAMDKARERYRLTSNGNTDKRSETTSTSTDEARERDEHIINGSDGSIPRSLEAMPISSTNLVEVEYKRLMSATSNFNQLSYKEGGNKLGEGGFGEVFHCRLSLGGRSLEIAVKVLSNKGEGSGSCDSRTSLESVERREFATEIQALSSLSHDCLVPVWGYSCDGPHLCLIYPFMANGSLDQHIHDVHVLTTPTRVGVACDIASALDYLHSGTQQVIVHRDVKSANVLLNKEFRGCLGDFGVARILPNPQASSVAMTTTVVGTLVYMAPEYSKGTVTTAADVYAFGVVLYELLIGKCAQSKILNEDTGEESDLLSYIDEFEGDQQELLIGQWTEGVWQKVWSLAEQCVQHNRKRRPSSSQVLHKLHSITPDQ